MKSINVAQLKEMMDKGEQFTLIDVREPGEYNSAHLGGTLIPLGTVPNNVSKFPKEGKVVVHCRSGKRSANAIRYLEESFGYNNLYNLEGGILAWSAEIDPSLNVS